MSPTSAHAGSTTVGSAQVSTVTFLDTSVLCELLAVPGKSRGDGVVRREFDERVAAGERFVLPITAVIETGNHIAQAPGDRRRCALALTALVEAAAADRPPFTTHDVRWDASFLADLLAGDGTGQSFADLAGNGQMGAGDVAILVERDRFVAASALAPEDVRIWTLEAVLGAYS